MKAVMVMFDSLNRHMLPPYGCEDIIAPNFKRLAQKTVTFDNSYGGSMPCMPARRELHTGRYNFLHRSWGPLEPFDDSMPEMLKKNGIYTHLVSDHFHYWEDGGCTYHNKYSSWEFSRGQEGDPWKGLVKDPDPKGTINRDGQFSGRGSIRQDLVNREYIQKEEDFPQAKSFKLGLEFMEKNVDQDNWFLQLETFDPHEPFFAPQRFKDLYPHDYNGPLFDWPTYRKVNETEEQINHIKNEYRALVTMCDEYLGKVLDLFDKNDLWKDTMLIVNTDHGYLLSEHDHWAKMTMPWYNELINTPLFIWDPRTSKKDIHCSSLVQTIDLAPTLLDFFGIEQTSDMLGHSLRQIIEDDSPVREAALFGMHGSHVNCTDGRYVYMKAPKNKENEPLYNYTLMPTHMNRMFEIESLKKATLAEPFNFSKGCPILKIEFSSWKTMFDFGDLLFDLKEDPKQENPIKDAKIEERMKNLMLSLMQDNDCPKEEYQRLGLYV